jgi:hypothetical protein
LKGPMGIVVVALLVGLVAADLLKLLQEHR